jgi:two-component system nitrogen regulation sensor histidine kinase GlnL
MSAERFREIPQQAAAPPGLLDAIVNNVDLALFAFDRKGRLIFANKAGEEFIGSDFNDIRHRQIKDLLPRARDLDLLVQKTATEGRSFSAKEMEIDIGRVVDVDLSLSPLYVGHDLEGAILSLREHHALPDRGDEQFDAVLYLLGAVAHEVKNPLSGIKGAAQILRGEVLQPEAVECVKLIVREADRLNSVLQSYLTMTRRPVFNPINVHEIIEHGLKVLGSLLGEKGIRVEKSYDPSLPLISGDESKLLQVLINILKNAAEAMDRVKTGRILTVSTRASNDYAVIYERNGSEEKQMKKRKQRWVLLTVRDTGVGIPKGDLTRIFLPFYTAKDGGSGLGLALSKKIIQDHGGTIRVKSTPGKGTSFTLYLPY